MPVIQHAGVFLFRIVFGGVEKKKWKNGYKLNRTILYVPSTQGHATMNNERK